MKTKFFAIAVFAACLSVNLFSQENKNNVAFDPATRTFSCGKKQIVFQPSGVFSVKSNDQVILKDVYLFIHTPFRQWMSNLQAHKKGPGFDGKTLQVKEVKTDASSITFNGQVPWTKDTMIPWSISAKITDDNKVEMTYQYKLPDNEKQKDHGVFAETINVQKITTSTNQVWDVQTQKPFSVFKPVELTLTTSNPADTLKVEVLTRGCRMVKTSLRLSLPQNQTGIYKFNLN